MKWLNPGSKSGPAAIGWRVTAACVVALMAPGLTWGAQPPLQPLDV